MANQLTLGGLIGKLELLAAVERPNHTPDPEILFDFEGAIGLVKRMCEQHGKVVKDWDSALNTLSQIQHVIEEHARRR